jgi:hypothetical protein
MKIPIILLLFCLLSWQAQAQFYISPGATVAADDGGLSVISLQDIDWVNDGTFSAGYSDVHFISTDGGDHSIGGSGNQGFDYLFVEMGTRKLVLDQAASAVRVLFSSGYFDLNGNDLDLTELIVDEGEDRSFIGPNGGAIVHQANLNAPTGENPGNLGAAITSAANLGQTTIRRTHQAATSDGGPSINRRYTISPTNNSGLNATLRFFYLDSELNGLSESGLELLRNDGSGWALGGTSARDASANWLEATGISSFTEWTAADGTFTSAIDLPGGQALRIGTPFPNPMSSSTAFVQLPVDSPTRLGVQLRLFDVLGRELASAQEVLIAGDKLVSFRTGTLPAGLYVLQLETEGQQVSYKLAVD